MRAPYDAPEIYALTDEAIAAASALTGASADEKAVESESAGAFAGGDPVAMLRRDAEAGDAEAMFKLGVRYFDGDGVSRDAAEAFRWWKRAADAGNVKATFNVGACYAKGEGVSQDWTQAVAWYRQAAEAGDADAMFNLGVCYEKGYGVSQDKAQAVAWYRQAEATVKRRQSPGEIYMRLLTVANRKTALADVKFDERGNRIETPETDELDSDPSVAIVPSER